MESKWSCKLTRKAEADLDSILRYLAVELANPNAAAAFADKLQAAMEEARTFPESGSLVINEYLPNTGVRKKSNWQLSHVLPARPGGRNGFCIADRLRQTKHRRNPSVYRRLIQIKTNRHSDSL